MTIPRQIDFTEKLEEDNGATMFLYYWKVAENYSELFFRSIKRKRIIQTIELQRKLNLLNAANDCIFAKIKCNIVNNQSNSDFSAGNKII